MRSVSGVSYHCLHPFTPMQWENYCPQNLSFHPTWSYLTGYSSHCAFKCEALSAAFNRIIQIIQIFWKWWIQSWNYPKKHHVSYSFESWQLYNRKYFRGAISIAWTMWEESETTARDCLLLLYLYVSIILSHSPRWREGRGEQCIPHKDKLNFDLLIFGIDAR